MYANIASRGGVRILRPDLSSAFVVETTHSRRYCTHGRNANIEPEKGSRDEH
jgi:hypothetical protein